MPAAIVLAQLTMPDFGTPFDLNGWTINTVDTGTVLLDDSVRKIDAHGICKNVQATDGKQYFVPTKSANEWNSFINGASSGVSLSECNSLSLKECVCKYGIADYHVATNYCNGITNTASVIHFNSLVVKKPGIGFISWGDTSLNINEDPMYLYSSIIGRGYMGVLPDGTIKTYGWVDYNYVPPPAGSITNKPIFTGKWTLGTGVLFATVQPDGNLLAWGDKYIIPNKPNGTFIENLTTGVGTIVSRRNDNMIITWGRQGFTNINYSIDGTNITKVYSNGFAYAGLKNDGSIITWGSASDGGTGGPTDNGYVSIYPNSSGTSYWSGTGAFAAIKADGSITSWGNSSNGGSGAPVKSGYVKVVPGAGFAALNQDGTVYSWGAVTNYPTGNNFVDIVGTGGGFFAALTDTGYIKSWGKFGNTDLTGTEPTDGGYIKIIASAGAFTALKADGSLKTWGYSSYVGNPPTDSGYVEVYSNGAVFMGLKADGSIKAWGLSNGYGASGVPTGTGYSASFFIAPQCYNL